MPPSLASAIAMRSSDTDCMMAETRGIFMLNPGSSPFLKRTTGVFSETFAGIHSTEE